MLVIRSIVLEANKSLPLLPQRFNYSQVLTVPRKLSQLPKTIKGMRERLLCVSVGP